MTLTAMTDNAYGFVVGSEITDQAGNRCVIVGVHVPTRTIGLKRSTWWRRLYWRIRGWFV